MPFPARGQLHLRRVGSVLCPDFLSILSESLSECILRHLRTPPASSLRRAVSILSGVWLRRAKFSLFFSCSHPLAAPDQIVLTYSAFLHFESPAIPVLHFPAFLPVPRPPVLRVKSLLRFGVSSACSWCIQLDHKNWERTMGEAAYS